MKMEPVVVTGFKLFPMETNAFNNYLEANFEKGIASSSWEDDAILVMIEDEQISIQEPTDLEDNFILVRCLASVENWVKRVITMAIKQWPWLIDGNITERFHNWQKALTWANMVLMIEDREETYDNLGFELGLNEGDDEIHAERSDLSEELDKLRKEANWTMGYLTGFSVYYGIF